MTCPIRQAVVAAADRLQRCGQAPSAARPLLIGYSGGIDSTVLLHAALAEMGRRCVHAVHINHQLQPASADWAAHCRDVAAQWQVSLTVLGAEPVPQRPNGGIENWARDQRRRLFRVAAHDRNAVGVALAHHADDQSETILMNLVRGAGLAGLSGMAAQRERDGLLVCRPLLDVGRHQVEQYATRYKLPYVQDPTNQDTALTRNRIRRDVLPAIEAMLPGFAVSLRRAGDNVARADKAMEHVLFGALGPPVSLSRDALRRREPVVAQQIVLLWLREHGLRLPRRELLHHLVTQLVDSNAGYAQVRIDDRLVCRYRDEISVRSLDSADTLVQQGDRIAHTLQWCGEPCVVLPGFDGKLVMRPSREGEPGIDAGWLASQSLRVTALRMSASIKPDANRPTRRIKQLCQEAAIARWDRPRLPMLWHADQVLFAAPFGLNHRVDEVDSTTAGRVCVAWQES